jgi:hypothetical protein
MTQAMDLLFVAESRPGRVQRGINAATMPAENTGRPTFCGCVEEPTDESRESSSLIFLSGSNPLRLLAVRLVKSKLIEAFILLLILTNTVFLALENLKCAV